MDEALRLELEVAKTDPDLAERVALALVRKFQQFGDGLCPELPHIKEACERLVARGVLTSAAREGIPHEGPDPYLTPEFLAGWARYEMRVDGGPWVPVHEPPAR